MDADQLIIEYENLLWQIAGLRNYRARKDLITMSNRCDQIRQSISVEAITCRRLHKPTVKYNELLEEFRTSLDVLSEYTTFAVLLDR